MDGNFLDLLARIGLTKESPIVVLTGAGVSAESGVPTFRGADGLWRKYRAEELATPEAFSRDPKLVWEWYDYRRQIISACKPNPAHFAIAKLDEFFPNFQLITQNVDGLHKSAGSRRIIELHGNIFRVRCLREGKTVESKEVPLKKIPPICECGSLLRPDVVWFGEAIPYDALQRSFQVSRDALLMIVVGTSGVVQPAASMPLLAKQSGAYVVEVNPVENPLTPFVDLSIRDSAAKTLPVITDFLIETSA
ncbi:MAG: SIR2 family NAD-dependent protein deacylase [bacterium]